MGQTLPQKKGHFFGVSRALDEKDFGYVSGRQNVAIRSEIKNSCSDIKDKRVWRDS